MTWRDDPRNLTPRDRAEVAAFRRYLAGPCEEAGTGAFRARWQGWLPYVLGLGPAPPDGLDHTPVAAWTMPA